MQDVYIGDVWQSKQGVERTVIDLVHQGYDPNDPNDVGSFEEYIVMYVINDKRHTCQDHEFAYWIEKEKATLIFSPDVKVSYRDCPDGELT